MTKPFGRPTSTRRHIARGVLGGFAVIGRAQFRPTAISLAAGAGSFALTGTAAALRLGKRIVAGAGSFVLTGTDVALNKGKRLVAGAGSFAVTGTAVSLLMSRKIVAAAGSFALTGQTVNLNKGQRLGAAAGSYALTGTAATPKQARKIAAAAAAYALTGTAATLTKASRSFTFVGSTTSNASTIDISGTGRQAGDFGVLLDYARGSSGAPAAATPSGHTQAATQSGGFGRVSITSKVLTGSEASLTGMNGDTANKKVYLVFRPTVAINTVAYNAGGAEVTNNNPAQQTIDPTAETTAVILVGEMGSSGTVSPRSTSPAMDEVANGTTQYGHYKIYNSSPASHTYDMDDEGNDNGMISGYFEFT